MSAVDVDPGVSRRGELPLDTIEDIRAVIEYLRDNPTLPFLERLLSGAPERTTEQWWDLSEALERFAEISSDFAASGWGAAVRPEIASILCPLDRFEAALTQIGARLDELLRPASKETGDCAHRAECGK